MTINKADNKEVLMLKIGCKKARTSSSLNQQRAETHDEVKMSSKETAQLNEEIDL